MPESEKDLERAVVELAILNSWLVYHTRDSRGSVAGFPDLVLVREGELIFAELKTEKGKLSSAQQQWLAMLATVSDESDPQVRVCLWKPQDWKTIEQVLRR